GSCQGVAVSGVAESPMTKREFAKARQAFNRAMHLHWSERQAYLERACPDLKIRREVEKYLASHDLDEHFMTVPTSIDRQVLHYQIEKQIGEGGMATVYKARDTRLERWVALKALQPWAMGHAGMREQLFHEAQRASALNHPNIVTIYEVAEQGGVYFIV